MDNEHEQRLAIKLEDLLARFIDKAGFEVIPPGTLGAGMGYNQTNKTTRAYDPARGVITLTGLVTIEISRRFQEGP